MSTDHLLASTHRARDLDTGAEGREVGHDRRHDELRVRQGPLGLAHSFPLGEHLDIALFQEPCDGLFLGQIVDVDPLADTQKLHANRLAVAGVVDAALTVEVFTEGVGQITQVDIDRVCVQIVV